MAIEYDALEMVINKGFPLVKTAQAEQIALFWIFVGVLFAVIMPYLIKVYQDKRSKFDYQYIVTAVLAGISAWLLFAGQSIPEGMSVLFYSVKAFFVGATVDTAYNTMVTTSEDTKK